MMSAYDLAQSSQRAAADPEANVFVTANAGSGKTKVLVDRIARLLLTGARPDAFLCVTYTKAAAAEMQRRLFERLGEWCVMSDEALSHKLRDLIGADLIDPPIGQARALFARALETPGGLKIQTIHAFCERLLRRFPLEARVAPGFEIADEPQARALVERAWGQAVAHPTHSLMFALRHFASKLDPESFADLREALMSQSNLLAHHGVEDAAHLAQAHLQICDRHGEAQSLEEIARSGVESLKVDTLHEWAILLQNSSANDERVGEALAEGVALAHRPLAAIDSLLAAFLTQKGEIADKRPTKALLKDHPWLGALWNDAANVAAHVSHRLRAARRRDDAIAALTIAHALRGGYKRAKLAMGLVDFDDLIRSAKGLLQDDEASPWVLFKLDGGLDHILVDEGQDTSPDQWALIEPLRREFFAGAGARAHVRTVFAVGDPKQSIYSFQGADPERFLLESQALQTQAERAEQKFLAPELAMSFRSTSEVLAAVDATFERIGVGAGAPGVFDKVRHFANRAGQTGLVEWWPIVPKSTRVAQHAWDAPLDHERGDQPHVLLAEALAKRVSAWIRNGEGVWDSQGGKPVLRAMRPGDVLALVKSRGALFKQLLKAFKREGLPVAGADRLLLRDDIAVQDMLALARVAMDPADDLSLACVLKGPFVGLVDDDADLFPLAYGRHEGESLFSRLLAASDRYAEARAFVQSLIARRAAHPHSFYSGVLDHLYADGQSGTARLLARLGEAARDPLDEFMARALNAGPFGVCNLHAFVHAIETDGAEVKRQPDDAGDVISIMTVHGAKGLERPVVILPQTTDAPKVAPQSGLVVTHNAFAMLGSKDDDDGVSAAVRAEHVARAEAEHLRLLYVAMTRARDRLIICGHASGNASETPALSWHRLTGDAMAQLGTPCETPFGEGRLLGEASKASVLRDPAPNTPASAPAWLWTPGPMPSRETVAPRPSGSSPGKSARARLQRGRWIHGLLQRLPDVAPERRHDAGLRWLARQPGVHDIDAGAMLDEALAVLDHEDFAAVFGPGSRAEAPIVARMPDGRGLNGIVDRLLVTPSSCLVADFKTERAPSAVSAMSPRILVQMRAYRTALQLIFPGRTVKAAVIWTQIPRLDHLPDALLDEASLEDAG